MELVLYANLFETIQIFPVQLHSISFALCFVTLCYILHKTSRWTIKSQQQMQKGS